MPEFSPESAREPQGKDVINMEKRDAAVTQIVKESRRRPTTMTHLNDPIERCSGIQGLPDSVQ
jgi:hypothetical protein